MLYVSNYSFCRIQLEGRLYDAERSERDLLATAKFIVFLYLFFFKVEGHAHADRTHGIFTALVVVLPKVVQTLRTCRTVCSESVYLEEAGAAVPAKQGTVLRVL